MIRTEFWAHSTGKADRSDWQGLADHLGGVAELAACRGAKFGVAEWARVAGLLHDAGKYSEAFQAYIEGKPSRVDHSTAGARIASERWKIPGRLLAFAIAGHHAGLANGAEAGDRTPLQSRLAFSAGIPDFSAFHQHMSLPDTLPSPPMRATTNGVGFCMAFFVRMLFSCLVDADRLDTERWDRATKGQAPLRSAWTQLATLRSALDGYLGNMQRSAEPSEVNTFRGEILAHIRSMAGAAPGLFSLTVPTGGGKTLASLAFALDHAITHELERVIYVIPYTSIIEQTAEVFREALGQAHEDCVLEHHSAFDDDKLMEAARKRGDPELGPQGREKLRHAAENWDVPIVVTTAVQFFESLFANTTTKCRKLHNIARSVVILDEAQTLPLHLLRPSVRALDELARNYGASIVLCTATQPALEARDDPARSFKGGLRNVRELAPDPVALASRLKRVTVANLGALDDAGLVTRLSGHDQALCIVPTRAHAREIYLALRAEPGTVHLSALMCPEHRSQRLAEIRRRLKGRLPCRLIATSLIEAGVDVDFPVVYRASAGIDSIAQAAGRCNREGKNAAASSMVYVFEPAGRKLPSGQEVTAQAGREIMRRHADDPLSLAAIEDYFRHVYWGLTAGRDNGLDKHGILARLELRSKDRLFPFEDVAGDFNLIDDTTRPVLIPFGEGGAIGEQLIEDLARTDNVSAIARKLQRYVVQVPHTAFAALRAAGAIQAVNEPRFGDQFWKLASRELYHEEFGLDWSDPTFRRAEGLIVS